MTPSDNLLRRLTRVSPTVAFIAVLAMLLAGFFLPGIIGAALLFVLFGVLTTLTFTTWPVQKKGTRIIRVILLALLLATVVTKIA